jgi:SEC-C motif-containing protein
MKRQAAEPCPCGRPRPYAECCGRLHAGVAAADAESLMRSRYCAYVLGREDYLLATWHATTRPVTLDLADGPQAKWLGLEVMSCAESGDEASVEFVALCRIGGRARRLREQSRFLREQGRWYYLDGVMT